MSFEVIVTEPFKRKFKKLAKKHRSLRKDLSTLVQALSESPETGTPLGNNCYKVRLAITSKGKGKSGGARVITFVKFTRKYVYLMDIYDKSDQDSISDKELKILVKLFSES